MKKAKSQKGKMVNLLFYLSAFSKSIFKFPHHICNNFVMLSTIPNIIFISNEK